MSKRSIVAFLTYQGKKSKCLFFNVFSGPLEITSSKTMRERDRWLFVFVPGGYGEGFSSCVPGLDSLSKRSPTQVRGPGLLRTIADQDQCKMRVLNTLQCSIANLLEKDGKELRAF